MSESPMTNSISEAQARAGKDYLRRLGISTYVTEAEITELYEEMSRASQPVDTGVDDTALVDMRRAAFAGGWNAAMGQGTGLTFEQKRAAWERDNALPKPITPPLDSEAVERVRSIVGGYRAGWADSCVTMVGERLFRLMHNAAAASNRREADCLDALRMRLQEQLEADEWNALIGAAHQLRMDAHRRDALTAMKEDDRGEGMVDE